MTPPRKVLLSAYACNPERGSEGGVGWGWVRMAARRNEVHVLTAGFNRPAIERWLAAHPADAVAGRLHFHYVPPRPWHFRPTRGWRVVEGSLLKPLMNLAYASWMRGAYRVARRLHAGHRFDLVHLVTYVGFRFPGRYWRLGIPFVWGPIGGLENTPWRLLPQLGARGAVYYAGRNLVNTLQKLLLPGPRRAMRAARGRLLAATGGMRREIRAWYGEESDVVCEIGLPGPLADHPTARAPGEPLRLAWSGEHLPGKALPLLLRALARAGRDVAWRLTVLGAGPCTARWRGLARRLGVDDRCTWTGWLPRDDALASLRAAHVFVITSLKDLTSTVLLEALASGLPVVCPDHCGFADVVTEHCGIKVAVRTPARIVAGFADAIGALAADEGRRARLAAGALARSAAFTWERKAERLEEIYARAVAPRPVPAPAARLAEVAGP